MIRVDDGSAPGLSFEVKKLFPLVKFCTQICFDHGFSAIATDKQGVRYINHEKTDAPG